MSHGNRPNQFLSGTNSSVVSPSIRIVTPGEFALTQARLNEAKALLANYEASNEMGYEAYLRLQQSIENGERAKQLLQSAFHTPSQSSRTVSAPNLLSVTGPNPQLVVGQSQYTQSIAKIEEVTPPSVTSAAPATGSSYSRPGAATVTDGGFNIQPAVSSGQGFQQPNDSRKHHSLSGAQRISNPLVTYGNVNQVSSGSVPTQQWWYGDQTYQQQRGHEKHASTTPALHHGRSERNHVVQPDGGFIHATHVAPVPQASTSSLHGALGQTTSTNVINSSSGRTFGKTEVPDSASVGFQANIQSHAMSAQAVDNNMTSSPGITAFSSYPPPQAETSQSSTSTQMVDHGTDGATAKSPPTNAEYLKMVREWGHKLQTAITLPIPLSNLMLLRDEKGKVDIICMAEPRSISPTKPSAPIRPFVYTDATGNYQYFNKPPAGSLHYYPPKQVPPQSAQQPTLSPQQPPQSKQRPPQSEQRPLPRHISQSGSKNTNENTQITFRVSLPTEHFPTTLPPPVTPVSRRSHGHRSPTQARKEHLARDILRSLGVPPATENRKRQRDDEFDADSLEEGSSKTHVIGGAGQDLPPTKPVDQPKFVTMDTTPTAGDTHQKNTYDLSTVSLDGKEQAPGLSHPVQPLSNFLYIGTTLNKSTPAIVPPSQAMLTPPASCALPQTNRAPPHSTPTQKNSAASGLDLSTGRITTPQPVTSSVAPVQSALGPSKVPLFLPSASSSPIPFSGNDDTVNDRNSPPGPGPLVDGPSESSIASPLRKSQATGRKRPQVYVLLPPLPAHLRTRKVRAPSEKDDGTSGGRFSSEDDIVEGNKTFGEVEREAVELSRTRLCEQPCGWQNCESVLNSTETLCKHVAKHAQDDDLSGVYCMWQHCVGKKFSDITKLTHHLENHTRSSLSCAYRNCDERFRTARELVKHHTSNHNENSVLKPIVTPFKPRLPPSLGPVPPVLPSYLVEARSVRQAAISQDRHVLLGPWVLRNICGPIDLGSRKQGSSVPQGAGSYEYDFLASKPMNRIPRLEDLDSVEISRLVHSGFIFWNPKDEPGDQIRISPDVGQNPIVQADENPEFQGSEATLAEVVQLSKDENEEGRFVPSEDEEAVQLMLGVVQDQ